MAAQLLCRREFREEDTFRVLNLSARGSMNPHSGSPTPHEPIKLHVSIFRRKIRRLDALFPDPQIGWQNAMSEVVAEEAGDAAGQQFSTEISPPVPLVEWQSIVFQVLKDFKLVYRQTHLRLSQELVTFLDEMATKAQDRGLGVLYVSARVEEVVIFMRRNWKLGGEPEMMVGSDGDKSDEVEEAVIQEIRIGEAIPGEMCVICQEEFSAEMGPISQLTCSHVFHFACIHPWLLRSFRCPLCRYRLPLVRLV